jgi:hypothetical protein
MVELCTVDFSIARLYRTHDPRLVEEDLMVWRRKG